MVPRKTRCFGIIGASLGVFGLLFGFCWEFIFDKLLEKQLVLRPTSLVYDLWQAPPIKITLDVYLFNWTNPEDFRNPAIKPRFQELGPYRYIETNEKVDIVWHEANSSVSYKKRSVYHFDAEGSRGSLNDSLITINALAVTGAVLAKKFSPLKRSLAEIGMLIYSRDLTLRRTVSEMLFEGFEDPLLTVINMVPIADISAPFKRFGYTGIRNASTDFYGTFNVHTGANDFSKIGQMVKWNYDNVSSSHSGKCAQIGGSAGEFLGPHLKPDSKVSLFIPEFCRDMPLEYDGVEYVDGIKGFRYTVGKKFVDNGTIYPENKCNCHGECLPSGVINVSACWFQSPIFVSNPHFYNADPYYLNTIDGLNPQKEKHEFKYVVEPKTSIGLDFVGRAQVNQLVQPIPQSRMFHDVRKVMIPLFWAEARTGLTPDLLNYFKIVKLCILFGQLFFGICFFVGLAMLFYEVYTRYWYEIVFNMDNVDFKQVVEEEKVVVNLKNSILEGNSILYIQQKKIKCELHEENLSPLLS